MPLARIITHSHACSRELALDLLARGYTVEIVSPDKIPDNIADLELRVDAAPGDQLIASVQTNNGTSKASLDFVHHLKAPMADFKRRPIAAEPSLPDHSTAAVVITPVVRAPHPVPKAVSASAKIVQRPESELEMAEQAQEPAQDEDRNSMFSGGLPVVAIESPSPARTSTTIPSTTIQPTTIQSTAASLDTHRERYHLPEFVRHLPLSIPNLKINSWRAPVALGSAAMLVAVLWFGFRQTGNRSQASVAARSVQAKSDSVHRPKSNDQQSNQWQIASQESSATPTAQSPTTPMSTAHQPRTRETGDYVARDTVVYLDKRFAEQAAAKVAKAKRPAERPATSTKIRDGVIAANSVTYLNGKQAPKPAPKPQLNSN